jgi:hypothetical protein
MMHDSNSATSGGMSTIDQVTFSIPANPWGNSRASAGLI